MIRFLFLALLLFSQSITFAQWNVESITDSLRRNSDAVIRRYASDLKVIEDGEVVVAEDIVVTLFDTEIVKQFALFWIVNKRAIGGINIKIFDAGGKRIKVDSNNKNFERINNGLLISYLENCSDLNMPFTVELEYRNARLSIKELSDWKPIKDFRVSVQSASLRVTSIDTTLIDIKSNKVPFVNKVDNEDGTFVSLWELTNFRAIDKTPNWELSQLDFPSVRFIKRDN
jgi:hypothetical protein